MTEVSTVATWGAGRSERTTGSLGRRGMLGGLVAAVPLLLAGCSSHSGKDGKASSGASSSGKGASGMASAAAAPSGGDDGDVFVMIIRHGEKPDGSQPGIDENGHQDSHSLTERGWARAKALPQLFDPPQGQPLKPGLARPTRIFAATDQGPKAGAHRMRQTVTPLAKALGLQLDLSYAESQEADLAKAVLGISSPVLICWEHSRIPHIVKGLGAEHSGAPGTWPDRFDLVWVLTRTSGKWTFREIQQHLLDGDA
ncbi:MULTISPECIES: histidine phosphatase family protein [Kitasatospora]|uniref:Histidine phosphatase family protein n=1 Tax=Kitasatospora cystarginea TaxID=58350 RepID=A0ABP5RM99_9ACTN